MTHNSMYMNGNGGYVKRDKLEILVRILEISITPVKKTHILYQANLNFYQVRRYLSLLLNLGMLEKVEEPYSGYRITDKGLQALELFTPEKGEYVEQANIITHKV